MQDSEQNLRTGFTTGTSATAASKAALLAIMNQDIISKVDVKLPKDKTLTITINQCSFSNGKATCSVIKNAGDDPDVTHGAEIVSEVVITQNKGKIEIEGGKGVGIVTKPGLGLELNKSAINPVPKKMINENLQETAGKLFERNGIKVIISVPKGEELAKKTDNPRLGIINGISILGTTGIVIPFSTASFAASIRQNLDVAIAAGNKEVVLTTGGRSEDFAKKIISLPDHCFVQMGDFSGYAIQQCAKKKIKKCHIVGFIGKLAKIAKGAKQTHVKGSKVDMKFLASLAAKCDAGEATLREIKTANTAREVSEIIQKNKIDGFFKTICLEVQDQMKNHSDKKFAVNVILFDFDGNVLARLEDK